MCSRVLVLNRGGFAGAFVGGHQIGRTPCCRFLFHRRQSATVFSQVLTKKDGQWQVDEMEMRDVAERTRSSLRLHLK